MAIEEGMEAPDFSLPAADGRTVRLADLRGAPVVVYFYPKDDTSGCTSEARDFSALSSEFAASGARVIGISPDSVSSHQRFRDKHGLTVTLASDADKTAAMAYGVWVEKSMYTWESSDRPSSSTGRGGSPGFGGRSRCRVTQPRSLLPSVP
jgi:peroxiredoxin Q/BCP